MQIFADRTIHFDDVLVVKEKGKKVAEAKLFETSQLTVMGNVQVTTQAVQELCRRGIPIIYTSSGGWYYGMTLGPLHKNVELRLHQYRAVDNPERALALSRRFVAAKIKNCRTLLRRNAEGVDDETLRRLKEAADQVATAQSLETLLGVEGAAARVYFVAFPKMLKRAGLEGGFSFEGRNRRPPKDPVNAMLSFAYALLTKECVCALLGEGLDPWWGLYHRPRHGRPGLALDRPRGAPASD